jgi:hypothetical protein
MQPDMNTERDVVLVYDAVLRNLEIPGEPSEVS